MAQKRVRADELMVSQDLVESKDKAQALIMAGKVFTLKEEKILTAGQQLKFNTALYIKGQEKQYVSRGAYKLEKAFEVFNLNVDQLTTLDIGSSTGGFTQVLLEHGAKLVYALDVGTNQLAWSLRDHPQVEVMEQTNFRYSKLEDFSRGRPEFACTDVSFISLKVILPVLANILTPSGQAVALIKPQFEARKEDVGKNGVVSDPRVHRQVLEDVLSFAAHNYKILGLVSSPIRGREGNREFLVHLESIEYQEQVDEQTKKSIDDYINKVIEKNL